jgi:hypothetical protein
MKCQPSQPTCGRSVTDSLVMLGRPWQEGIEHKNQRAPRLTARIEGANQDGCSEPVARLPATLLRFPVALRCPVGDAVVDRGATSEHRMATTWIANAIKARRQEDLVRGSKGSNKGRLSTADVAIQNGMTRPRSAASDARKRLCRSKGNRFGAGRANVAMVGSLPHQTKDHGRC